jgi:hypothetical protein
MLTLVDIEVAMLLVWLAFSVRLVKALEQPTHPSAPAALVEENLLHLAAHPTTPRDVSAALLAMAREINARHPMAGAEKERGDWELKLLLVEDFLRDQGLPPCTYDVDLTHRQPGWQHPSAFLTSVEQDERLRILQELHDCHHHPGQDECAPFLEALGRSLRDRRDWERLLLGYNVLFRKTVPADPAVQEQLDQSLNEQPYLQELRCLEREAGLLHRLR